MPVVETFAKPAQGAAMSQSGSDCPVCTVPFPGRKLLGAFPLGTDRVLFAGVRSAQAAVDPLLLALYDLPSGRIVLRRELAGYPEAFLRLSRDRRRLLVSGSRGLAVVDTATLEAVARCEFERREGGRITYVPAEADDLNYSSEPDVIDRARERHTAGWRRELIQFAFEVGEIDAAHLIRVHRWPDPVAQGSDQKEQRFDVINWRAMTGQTVIFRSAAQPTALDRLDPGADLFYVMRDQLALFWASPPRSMAEPGLFACGDPSLHAVVLILWRLGGSQPPRYVAVREADANAWLASDRRHFSGAIGVSEKLRPMQEAVSLPSPQSEVAQPALWSAAAVRLLVAVFEDPRDGLAWLCFADDHIRSLNGAGQLGPLVRLGGVPNVPDDDSMARYYRGPRLSFQGDNLIVVKVHSRRHGEKMARYVFRAADMEGKTSQSP